MRTFRLAGFLAASFCVAFHPRPCRADLPSQPYSPVSESTASGEPSKSPRYRLILENFAHIYNCENGEWGKTRGEGVTYIEDVFQPYVQIDVGEKLQFNVGAGLYIPFNQEDKILRYFPYIQSKYTTDDFITIVGSLQGNHDLPSVIRDPLIDLVPRIRLNNTDQIPIPYETYPDGIYSHGKYEYGAQIIWPHFLGRGEAYMNWQLRDVPNHRERFDIGIAQRFDIVPGLPLYAAAHYWHNGGHENPHPVEITEDYVAGVGLRNDTFDALYLLSFFVADRAKPSSSISGQAIYFDYNFRWGSWLLQPQFFMSDEELGVSKHQFITIEGDPFFRLPLYLGINVFKTWTIAPGADIRLGFVNGVYVPERGRGINARYDQMLRFNFRTAINL